MPHGDEHAWCPHNRDTYGEILGRAADARMIWPLTNFNPLVSGVSDTNNGTTCLGQPIQGRQWWVQLEAGPRLLV